MKYNFLDEAYEFINSNENIYNEAVEYISDYLDYYNLDESYIDEALMSYINESKIIASVRHLLQRKKIKNLENEKNAHYKNILRNKENIEYIKKHPYEEKDKNCRNPMTAKEVNEKTNKIFQDRLKKSEDDFNNTRNKLKSIYRTDGEYIQAGRNKLNNSKFGKAVNNFGSNLRTKIRDFRSRKEMPENGMPEYNKYADGLAESLDYALSQLNEEAQYDLLSFVEDYLDYYNLDESYIDEAIEAWCES